MTLQLQLLTQRTQLQPVDARRVDRAYSRTVELVEHELDLGGGLHTDDELVAALVTDVPLLRDASDRDRKPHEGVNRTALLLTLARRTRIRPVDIRVQLFLLFLCHLHFQFLFQKIFFVNLAC